jgi:hypothetical protein
MGFQSLLTPSRPSGSCSAFTYAIRDQYVGAVILRYQPEHLRHPGNCTHNES